MMHSEGRPEDVAKRKLDRTDTLVLRDLLSQISMCADLRLYKWREWVGQELSDEMLADALDELSRHISHYVLRFTELSAKLRGRG